MKITFLLIICLALSSPLAYAGTHMRIYGEARDVDTAELRYTEEHLINNILHQVTYRQVDGSVMADKNIQYTRDFSTPNFQLYDHRFGRTYGSKWQDGEWLLWRQEKSGDRDEKLIPPEATLVVDSGFNHFVLQHIEELSQDKELEFIFAITNPPMGIPMTIKNKSCTDKVFSPQDNPQSDKVLCLKIVSQNVIWRLFIPVIYLAYIQNPEADGITHLLSLYQGPSNLPDNRDKEQNVRIEYRYVFFHDNDPQPTPASTLNPK